MMTAVDNAKLNDLGWVHEHWLGRMHFEKLIERIVYVLDYYALEHTLPGYAIEDIDEYSQDQNSKIDNHLVERNDHDSLDGYWHGMIIHDDDVLIEMSLEAELIV